MTAGNMQWISIRQKTKLMAVRINVTVNKVCCSNEFPIFTAKMGIEGLCCMSAWTSATSNMHELAQARTDTRFTQEWKTFFHSRVGRAQPRDGPMLHVPGKNCKKLADISCSSKSQ